jgi:hypothetical protein
MVRLKVALAASPGYAPRLLDALRFLIGETRLEDGCVTCAAWIDAGPPGGYDATVHYLEERENEPNMRQRVLSDAFTSLLSVMEAATRAPHIEFDFTAAQRGLDYIAEVRQQPDPQLSGGVR